MVEPIGYISLAESIECIFFFKSYRHDSISLFTFQLEAMRNMTLQVTLTLGQIEVDIEGDRSKLKNSVLMHVDDINDVNSMIRVQ